MRNLIRITFWIAVFIAPILSSGQTFKILDFSSSFNDLSAQTESRADLNGVKCGLVKVRCVLDGVSFKGNVIGGVEYRDGEYWVYLSNGSKNLSVFHSRLLPLDIELGNLYKESIKSSKTYLLTLMIPDALYSSVLNLSPETISQNVSTSPQIEEFNNSTISGTVTDVKDGEPLIGCLVMVKGTNIATASDIDGNYTLKNIPSSCKLLISYVGYKQKEIAFTGKIPRNFNVSLRTGRGTEHEEYFYDPNDQSTYFDLKGDALPSRPSKKGTYIRVINGKPEKFTIK